MRRVVGPVLAGLLLTNAAQAAVVNFIDDEAGFTAAAASQTLSVIDFESLVGRDLSGQTVQGATFSSPDGNSLDVVSAAATGTVAASYVSGVPDPTTNVLFATSGGAVLAPGGPEMFGGNVLSQRDSLEITFAAPVSAFALDVLYQSLDFNPLNGLSVFDVDGNLILNAPIEDGNAFPGGSPAGSIFVGLVSDDPLTDFARILISETDSDAAFPDNNIGYDTIRFSRITEPPAIPVPATLPMGLAAIAVMSAMGRMKSRRRTA